MVVGSFSLSVPVVSHLLGHSNVGMTLRDGHLEDRDMEAAAERVEHAATIISLEKADNRV